MFGQPCLDTCLDTCFINTVELRSPFLDFFLFDSLRSLSSSPLSMSYAPTQKTERVCNCLCAAIQRGGTWMLTRR